MFKEHQTSSLKCLNFYFTSSIFQLFNMFCFSIVFSVASINNLISSNYNFWWISSIFQQNFKKGFAKKKKKKSVRMQITVGQKRANKQHVFSDFIDSNVQSLLELRVCNLHLPVVDLWHHRPMYHWRGMESQYLLERVTLTVMHTGQSG